MPKQAKRSRSPQHTRALSMLGIVAAVSNTYAAPLLKVAGPFDYNDTPGNGYIGGHLAYAPGASVNPSGVAVGYTGKVVAGNTKGNVAVRWNASGTASLEMGNLGMDSTGSAYSYPYAVNAVGTAVGYGWKYVAGSYQGRAPIRWSATDGTATELATLGGGDARAFALNDAGTAIGYSVRFAGEKLRFDGLHRALPSPCWVHWARPNRVPQFPRRTPSINLAMPQDTARNTPQVF